jgi:hypothetical protein
MPLDMDIKGEIMANQLDQLNKLLDSFKKLTGKNAPTGKEQTAKLKEMADIMTDMVKKGNKK